MFKKITTIKNALIAAIGLAAFPAQAQVSSFESLSVVGSNSYWNGSGPDVNGIVTSGGASFPNTYSTAYGGYWSSGWAFSDVNNTTLAGSTNLYASIAGTVTGIYAVGQQESVLTFSGIQTVTGVQITNSTYAYLVMRDGNMFARSFTGANNDYFKLTINGYQNGILNTTTGVDFYLADFRSVTGVNTIVNTWQTVDLTTLGGVTGLKFTLASSDEGAYGINTPTFFCLDNLSTSGGNVSNFENIEIGSDGYWNKAEKIFENSFTNGAATFKTEFSTSSYGDYWKSGFAYSTTTNTTLSGTGNLYSNITGKGVNDSEVFAIVQNYSTLVLSSNMSVTGFYATNTTYDYFSLKNGDSFAKKFGGASGNDPDYFKFIVKGYSTGTLKVDSVEFYLADFRNADNTKDYIVTTWNWVDLSKLGKVDSLAFSFSSSDAGQFGINTPLFFAMDDFNAAAKVNTTGIESAFEQSLTIFPNPVENELNFVLSGTEKTEIQIINVLGNVVLETKTIGSTAISVSGLEAGVYVVKVKSGERTVSKRLIKN